MEFDPSVPAFLLTTTNHVLAFDGQNRFFRVHSGKGLYYGLAADEQGVYVSCRNKTTGPLDPVERAGETGSILVLDRESLSPAGELRPEDFPLRDVHGIAAFDGKLWVTCAFDNLVAIFDKTTKRWVKWYPSPEPSACGRDVHHFNTVVPHGESICLLAHNNGPSHLLFYDRSSLELCSVMELGSQSHDIFTRDGGIASCSSAEGLLVDSTGWTIRTGAFPRGIAFGDGCVLLGLSQVAHRSVRHQASGILRRFTAGWHFMADYVLPGVGMVLAILPVDLNWKRLAALEPFEAQVHHGVYNPLEPGNVYRPGGSGAAVFAPEWHVGEGTHRWTAARRARMTVVVNPGETTLEIGASSAFPGAYWAEVSLSGRSAGIVRWPQPGETTAQIPLPPGTQGRCEVGFRVPHLWRPSVALKNDDGRMVGVSLRELRIF